MAELAENPYSPPETVSLPAVAAESAPTGPRILLRITRGLILGSIGYAVFVEVGSYYRDGRMDGLIRPSLMGEDWTTGLLLSLVFASTELLNAGRGYAAGLVRRMLISSALMLATVLVVLTLGTAADFRVHSYGETMRVCYIYTGITAVVFIFALLAIKLIWIRER
jgi:hypothetical protein